MTTMHPSKLKILGIDPGSGIIGFGVIQKTLRKPKMLDAGAVEIDGTVATMTTVPHSGEMIAFRSPPPDAALIAEDLDFDIAFDSDEIIVVNKPPGLVVHPGSGNASGTLVNGLIHRFPELAALGEEYRWGLVHRLDRDTSGLLLVARTATMHGYLQAELKARSIGRTYFAVVVGSLEAATGTIDAPIGRDPLRPTKMALVQDGRPAVTHYTRLAEWQESTLAEVRLETGRTHQIRVHLSAIDHAVVGDLMYGRGISIAGDPGRVWLHAAKLRFALPDGEQREVVADLPADLRQSLVELGQPISGEVTI